MINVMDHSYYRDKISFMALLILSSLFYLFLDVFVPQSGEIYDLQLNL